jgi:hypothetical protein
VVGAKLFDRLMTYDSTPAIPYVWADSYVVGGLEGALTMARVPARHQSEVPSDIAEQADFGRRIRGVK